LLCSNKIEVEKRERDEEAIQKLKRNPSAKIACFAVVGLQKFKVSLFLSLALK